MKSNNKSRINVSSLIKSDPNYALESAAGATGEQADEQMEDENDLGTRPQADASDDDYDSEEEKGDMIAE